MTDHLKVGGVALLGIALALLGSPVRAQPAEIRPVAVVAAQDAAAPRLRLDRDTLVRLMVVNEVSTRTTRAGDRFWLRVDEPVTVAGTTLIPVGAKAWGEVISADSSGTIGKSGKLSARLLYIELGDQKLELQGDTRTSGKSGTTETVMGVIGLGPLGLLARGNNAKLKAGEILNGSFVHDLEFDRATGLFAKAAATAVTLVATPPLSPAATTASVTP